MAMENIVEEIKLRTDLVDLVSSYGIAVKRAGASAKACCPFHHEKTPSFNINQTKGFYHCFGCGESGDAIKFVQKMDGLSFMEAVRKLAEPLGIKVDEPKADPEANKRKRLRALMAELAQFYHRCLVQMKESQIARDYLKQRDLDEKTCDDWQIGYAPVGSVPIFKWAEKHGYTPEELQDAGVVLLPSRPGDSGYHRFAGRLMFSICDRQGRVVAFSGRQLREQKNSGKYVNSPETAIFKKSNVLFGFDKAAANIAKSPHREAIACEGQIDTIRLHMNGFPIAVASQGTAFTEEHAKMLKRVCDSIVLAYDDDGAGHKATVKVGSMMLSLEVPVRVVSIPDGDDPDSYLRKHGGESFRKLMDDAESIVSFQVRIERAKEANPNSIDAVSRISKAVLMTIAHCPNAVLKASMVDEAAKLLSLPTAALNEELGKVRLERSERVLTSDRTDSRVMAGNGAAGVGDGEAVVGEDAGAVAPPPKLEMSFMEFLMANQGSGELDAMVGECLPKDVFANDFTWRFVEAWRCAVVSGEDRLDAFSATLRGRAREWFETLVSAGARSESSGLTAAETLKEFIREIWIGALKRRQGGLSAGSDGKDALKRLEISRAVRGLKMVKWNAVKAMIGRMIKEG